MFKQRNQSAQRREGIVHRVDRAARGIGRDGGEERRVEDAEAHFLALHVAIGRIDPELCEVRIARRFEVPADDHAREKDDEHCRPDRPTMALVLDHAAEVPGQAAGDRKD